MALNHWAGSQASCLKVTTNDRAHNCLNYYVSFVLYVLYGVAQWLRRCATSRTVQGSFPGGVTGFFIDISPSDRTMVLGSTQPLVKISTRNIPGVKAAGA